MTVKVRYAPSPTGPLHIGGARTVLFNWLYARKHKGVFLVRSEDTDRERSKVEWEKEIADSLRWLGMDWEEGIEVGGPNAPYRQTERLEIYKNYLSKLWLEGHVYYCFCTPEELAKDREEAMSKGENPGYSGRCRNLTPQEIQEKIDSGHEPSIRFRSPRDEDIVFDDLIRGQVTINTKEVGDFIIIKSDGIPTYNFAVVIDDITMGITHIIRANEHLVNTPKQILIYRALGEDMPTFAHVSLILDSSGRKMSKRMGDMSVDAYANKGYLPEAVVNFLALLGWSPEGEQEIMSIEDLISNFDLSRVSKSPAVFDFQKLDWINNHYIRNYDLGTLADMSIPHLEGAGLSKPDKGWLEYVLEVVRDELNCLQELPKHVQEFFAQDVTIEEQALEHLKLDSTPLVLDEFVNRLTELKAIEDYRELQAQVQSLLKQLNKDLKKQAGVSGKAVFMPIRVAMTGATSGQELYYLVPILGIDKVLARINSSRAQAGI